MFVWCGPLKASYGQFALSQFFAELYKNSFHGSEYNQP